MSNRNLKTYKQFIFNNILMENVTLEDIETTTKINSILKRKYNQIYFNQLLMLDIIDDKLNENIEDVALKIQLGKWDNNPKNFYESMIKSNKIEFLTPYSIDDLKKFNLYKVENYNMGFAIKTDGEIILVHNNEEIKGIGNYLLNKAIQFGGNNLNHFDGKLTGFYRKLNFYCDNNIIFSKDYSPKSWKYIPVNIDNENTSIYKNEINVSVSSYVKAKERYDNGMPDIVFRKLK